MMPWRTFLARVGAASGLFGLAMFAAIRLATADPGGPTRPELTYSGVLRNRDWSAAGTIMLTFTFTKTGGATCAPLPVTASVAVGGAFTVPVPLGTCANFFDGSDVTYTVTTPGDSMPLAADVRVTPVPYARFADQAGVNNDCPAGYTRVVDSDVGVSPSVVLCSRGVDQVVKVGVRGSAFWIDRYEASVWSNEAATDVQFGAGAAGADDYPSSFPDNGQWTTPLYALSYAAGGISSPTVFPSRSLTWFQAQAACRSSGKRLPTGEEWLAAAQGTVDPGPNAGNPGPCRTMAGAPRQTGLARTPAVPETCISRWGAEDMIGNVGEMTGEWYLTVRDGVAGEWPGAGSGFGGDQTQAIAPVSYPGPTGVTGPVTIPSAAIRGGTYQIGNRAGIFAIQVDYNVTSARSDHGFRCVIQR